MKKLLLSTALAAVTTFGMTAHASAFQTQAQTQAQAETRAAAQSNSSTSVPAFLSSSFTGMSVYNLDTDTDSATALRNRNADSASAQNTSRWTRSDTFSSDRDDWNDIGQIKDIVMTQDGEIHGILVDVGGFLGLGAHTVLVDIDELYFVSDSDETDELEDFFVVISMTQDELEILPEWNDDLLRAGFGTRIGNAQGSDAMESGSSTTHRTSMTPAQTQSTRAPTTTTAGLTEGNNARDDADEARADARAEVTASRAERSASPSNRSEAEAEAVAERNERTNGQAEAAEARAERAAAQAETAAAREEAARADRATRDAERSAAVFSDEYEMLGAEERTVDRLMGADVFDNAGNKVGSVKDVVIGGDDDVLSLLVDVGGFLGMGAHTVNLPINDAEIGWSQSNDDVRVQVEMTRSQLEAMPAHEED
ncbi:PRC-barrel domain-containing protein [Hyphomonadaceae bacterium ML37]|nr:PRC-barrel domain-containing protein [Hyphomonadaceae bacterium ML37]